MNESSDPKPQFSFISKLDGNPQIGISLDSRNSGTEGSALIRGFLYDAQGQIFFNSLESIAQIYLNDWLNRNQLKQSKIDNCLIQVSPENDVCVNINCPMRMNIVPKQVPTSGIKKGDPITRENIADIKRVEFLNTELQSNHGKIFRFSIGWRRGIYIDLTPLFQNSNGLSEQFENSLATYFAFLMFPEIVDIYPKIKNKLFERGWFPFVRLLGNSFKQLSIAIVNNLDLNEFETNIVDSFSKDQLLSISENWMNNPLFKKHEDILRQGIKTFIEGDYISSSHILFLRIEGLLRYLFAKRSEKFASISDLRKSLLEEIGNKNAITNLFLPLDFDEYLSGFYFKNFSISEKQLDISRHSIAHGVIQSENLSKISAFQAIMILDQINYLI